MSADEEIKVGDIVKFLYNTSSGIYRLGIVRKIEPGNSPEPPHNTPGFKYTAYDIEVLGQRIVQTYTPTGKIMPGLYKHRRNMKKYRAPQFVEQLLRASNPIDPTKVSMPPEIKLEILHAAGMIGKGDKNSLYQRVVPPPIRSGDGKWVPGTVETLLLPRETAAAGGGSKSRRTRRNKRLSRRATS